MLDEWEFRTDADFRVIRTSVFFFAINTYLLRKYTKMWEYDWNLKKGTEKERNSHSFSIERRKYIHFFFFLIGSRLLFQSIFEFN